MDNDKTKFSGYMVALGCTLVIFCHFGTCFIITVMMPYFVEKFNTTLAMVAGSTSVGAGMGFLCSFTSAPVIKKFTARGALIIGTIFCAVFMAINAVASQVWMIYISNGLSGFIIAYGAQVSCTSIINNWFIEKRSTVIGVVLGSTAFGGALFMFLTGQLIGRVGQFATYGILGVVAVGIALFCEIFLIHNKPEDIGQKPLGWNNSVRNQETTVLAEEEISLEPQAARRSSAFIIMIIATFIGAMLYGGFSTFAPSFWTSNGIPSATAASYASIASLAGAVATMSIGIIADKWGLKTYMFILFGCYFIGMVFAILWGTILPVTLIMVLNICFSSAATPIQGMSSTVAKPVFGTKAADSINGILMAFFYGGNMICNIAIGTIVDMTGSFIPAFIALCGICILTFFLMLIALKLSPMKKLADQKATEKVA